MILSPIAPNFDLTSEQAATFPVDRPITLHTSSEASGGGSFEATATQLTLFKSEAGGLQDCHLVLAISLAQYQQVLEQGWFYLKPEVRGPLQQADFQPDQPILLELGLEPQVLAHLGTLEGNIEAVLSQVPTLFTLAETPPDETTRDRCDELLTALLTASSEDDEVAPWLQADSWLCRSVQQRQGDETVGYATLWAYTTPAQAEPVIESGSEILTAIATLLQKTTTAIKSEVEPELPHLQQHLSQFSDQLTAALEQVDWEQALAHLNPVPTSPPVSEVVKDFFDADDWAYVQRSESTALQLAFQGDAGRWTCLAQCDDAAEQIVFYSICPVTAPADRRGAIAEFLTRANDGLIIGNFELTYDTGEIRYKTSLDVEGDRLTPALMQRLVYANVQTLDTYLPGILAVLEEQQAPAAAITRIEAPTPNNLDPTDPATAYPAAPK
jgi:hypothetical protein